MLSDSDDDHPLDRGPWMQTFTGKPFHVLDPRPEDIDLVDVAHALSICARYAGHSRVPYSVGQHSMLVADTLVAENVVFPTESAFHSMRGAQSILMRWGDTWSTHGWSFGAIQELGARDGLEAVDLFLRGILHDAAEAYVCDLPRPLKMCLPDYKKIELRVEDALFKRFGLSPNTDEMARKIKHADRIVLATERRDIMNRCVRAWDLDEQGYTELKQEIVPVHWTVAETCFREAVQAALELRARFVRGEPNTEVT